MIKNQFDFTSPGNLPLLFYLRHGEPVSLESPPFPSQFQDLCHKMLSSSSPDSLSPQNYFFNVYQMHLHIATPSPSVICKKTFVLLVDLTKRLPNLSKTDSIYITLFLEEYSSHESNLPVLASNFQVTSLEA